MNKQFKNSSFAARTKMQNTSILYNLTVSLVDETFDSFNTRNYHLAIEISNHGLTYALLDTQRNKYIVLEQVIFQKAFTPELLSNEIHAYVTHKSLLRSNFKSISICLFSSKFTLIPSALFDERITDKYLEFNSPVNDSENILSDVIKNFETQCVYAIDKKIITCLDELFPSARIVHTLSPLLEIVSRTFKNVSGKNIIIHLQQGHFELLVIEEKKLIFANIFSYQTSEDFLYFTLFVCEQLKLNPENIDLLLLGEVEKKSAIYSILTKYVRNVKFGKRPEMFEYSYIFDQTASHFYFNLFSQILCV